MSEQFDQNKWGAGWRRFKLTSSTDSTEHQDNRRRALASLMGAKNFILITDDEQDPNEAWSIFMDGSLRDLADASATLITSIHENFARVRKELEGSPDPDLE